MNGILSDKQALVVLLVIAGGAWYLRKRGAAVIEAVNPFNNENIVINSVESAVGEDRVAVIGDYIFGGIALLNPWADDTSKNYARNVYGLDDEAN